ncbi:MAG: hypothetical protein Q8K92_19965 [Leadbetterella sp.]|nr:hypothetical protein [Leadbetterella sp.]
MSLKPEWKNKQVNCAIYGTVTLDPSLPDYILNDLKETHKFLFNEPEKSSSKDGKLAVSDNGSSDNGTIASGATSNTGSSKNKYDRKEA